MTFILMIKVIFHLNYKEEVSMNLLNLKRQVKFVNDMNSLLNDDQDFSDSELAISVGFDLNDPLLRLSLLPNSKFKRVTELALLLLISQDKSLILSGKKKLALNQIFSKQAQSESAKLKLSSSGPSITIELLQDLDFIDKSSYLIYKRVYQDSFPEVYSKLMWRWTPAPQVSPELKHYWDSFASKNLSLALTSAFGKICKSSSELNFELVAIN